MSATIYFINDEKSFYFILKAILVLKYLSFFLDFLNFKIYAVTTWLINNYSSEIQTFRNLTVDNIFGVDFSFLQHYPKMLQIQTKLFKTQNKTILL